MGRIAAARGIDKRHSLPGAFVRHMAVMATLVQGLTLAEARALATKEREALGSAASLDATIAALTDALPEAGANVGVAPILPDIVGEGAILAWMGPNGGLAASGIDPQPRIAGAARVALAKVSATLIRRAGFRRRRFRGANSLVGSPCGRSGNRPRRADGNRQRPPR